jgi:nucleoid DNA-binding protein
MGVKLTRYKLARVVAEVLNVPYEWYEGPCQDSVNAVFRVIKDALLRGEEVAVAGFGKFKIRVRPAKRSACDPSYSNRKRGQVTIIKQLPPKPYVHFEPSKVLLRMLNGN